MPLPEAVAGARRPAIHGKKQRNPQNLAPAFHSLELLPAFGGVHNTKAHHKFTGLAAVVAIRSRFGEFPTFAFHGLLSFSFQTFACHLVPSKCYFTDWPRFVPAA